MRTSPPEPCHRLAVRVYYEDTDAGGIVYHASYLRFAERARTELMRGLGLDHAGLRAEAGVIFTVRRCVLDYLAPARLDDLLEVRTTTVRVRGASLDLIQEVVRGERLLVRLHVKLALLRPDLRPARLPPELRTRLQGPPRPAAGGN